MKHFFPEHARQFSNSTGDKLLTTAESIGARECTVKLGDSRSVNLLKMPGSSSCHRDHQVMKELSNGTAETGGGDDEVGLKQNGDMNLQWGLKKRTRYNKADVNTSSMEESLGDKKSRRDIRDIRDADMTTATVASNADANCSVLDSEAHISRKAKRYDHANTAAPPLTVKAFQWPKFSVSLSREEKEEDFYAITGCKLPKRPKKRVKHVEKTVHLISPGSSLCETRKERYEVKEKKVVKRKPGGLKAMIDSDSD